MSEHSCWRFYGTHGKKLASGFTKYGFILWNRLGIVAHTIFQQSKNNELLKNRQKWVSLETTSQTNCYIPINSTDFTPNQIQIPYSQKKEYWFYLHRLLSYCPNKAMNASYLITYCVLSFDTKNVMIFGFLMLRASQRYINEWFPSNSFESLLYLKHHTRPYTNSPKSISLISPATSMKLAGFISEWTIPKMKK